MNYLSLLIWVPQFGIAAASPLICFIALAVWLRDQYGIGNWILYTAILLGVFTAYIGARDTLKAITLSKKADAPSTVISFNDHL